MSFVDEDRTTIKVKCQPTASGGTLSDAITSIRYGLVISVETALESQLDIYEDVRNNLMLLTQSQVRARS